MKKMIVLFTILLSTSLQLFPSDEGDVWKGLLGVAAVFTGFVVSSNCFPPLFVIDRDSPLDEQFNSTDVSRSRMNSVDNFGPIPLIRRVSSPHDSCVHDNVTGTYRKVLEQFAAHPIIAVDSVAMQTCVDATTHQTVASTQALSEIVSGQSLAIAAAISLSRSVSRSSSKQNFYAESDSQNSATAAFTNVQGHAAEATIVVQGLRRTLSGQVSSMSCAAALSRSASNKAFHLKNNAQDSDYDFVDRED